MSFEIQIGITKSPHNKITKDFTVSYTLQGTLRSECSIFNPTIDLRIGDSVDIKIPSLTKCNYMYIPNFNRYYFITDIKSIRNTMASVSGHVDVLKTFSSQILANSAIISRTASGGDDFMYLDTSNLWKLYNNPIETTIPFPNKPNTANSLILVTSTGAGTVTSDS